MDKKIAITGVRQTEHKLTASCSRERMYYELAKGLYNDLKITREDVGTFVLFSNDFADGRTISEVYLIQRIGAYMKDETKVEMEGLNAVLYATMRLLSGQYETALVIGGSMSGSEFKTPLLQHYTMDPVYERPRGLMNFYSLAGLQAGAYLAKNKTFREEHFSKLAHKNIKNASRNPYSVNYKGDVPGAERIRDSKPLYLPLREGYVPPQVDGGAALLLATEEQARKLTDKPVWILGMGHSLDSYYIGDRDLLGLPSLKDAAKRAYKMAGIKNPEKEFDFAELHTNFATEEVIFQEVLGLFKKGSGAKVVDDGISTVDGRLPVNPSGGTFAGNPFNTGGILRLVEAVNQLRGEAGENQVKGAKRALVHSQNGPAAQHNIVLVLGN